MERTRPYSVVPRLCFALAFMSFGVEALARGSHYHCGRRCNPLGILAEIAILAIGLLTYISISKFKRWATYTLIGHA
ncbi:UNVERIFIED_ORG: hypothetical protein BDU10_3091 [Burkholderia sp. CF145]